jgi:uncharacterized membrane protein
VFDFHPSTLAVLPLAWLVVAVQHDDRRPVVLAALAVVLCRADLGWLVAATALAARPRHRGLLVATGVAGVVLGSIVPAALGGEGTFEIHYGQLGDGPLEVVTHPWRLLTAFAVADARTVFLWALGVGLLVVLSWRWSLAVLVGGLPVLLSRWPGTEDPYFHYGAPLVPLLLAGAVAAMASGHRRANPKVLVAGAIVTTLLAGPLSPKVPEPYSVATVARENFDGHLDDALAAVDDDEPVSATNRAIPHLSHRTLVYGFPIPFVSGELSVLYGAADAAVAEQIHVVIGRPADREQMERFGFDVEDLGGILVGTRRP